MNCPVVLLTGLLILTACKKPGNGDNKSKSENSAGNPTPVEAVALKKSPLTRVVFASGVANGIREVVVVSETRGKIRKVAFSLGDYLAKDQLLLQVDATVQKSALAQAKKALEAANLNLKVMNDMHKSGNASDAELKSAQNQQAGALAAYEAAEKIWRDCSLTAPIAGYIAMKDPGIQTGNVLAPGAVVSRIVDISRLKTTVSVSEMEVSLLKKGMPAEISVPAVGETTFSGRISAVSAGSNPATGAFPFEVTWKNTRNRAVKAGMTVRIRVATQKPDSVILVPASAIVNRNGKKAVFVVIKEKAAVRFVQTGRLHLDHITISEGLGTGEILITSGVTELKRGAPVAATLLPASRATHEHR